MKKTIFTLLFFALVSCKQKEPGKLDFLQRAINSDDYKIVSSNFQRVNDSLEILKKRQINTAVVIYEYNNIAGNRTVQAKTIAEVVTHMNEMNKDSSFLKDVQQHLAAKLEQDHRDSIKNQH